jgi:putative DNA primase/helicase
MTTKERARGKWRGILLALGAPEKALVNDHGPCPFCGGDDRFRWDNGEGNGSFICGKCGAGDGFDFVRRLKGCDFRTAALEVDRVMGHVRAEPVPEKMTEARRVELLNNLWTVSRPLVPGDPVTEYLAGRSVLPGRLPTCLRYHPACPAPGGSKLPAMLALVTGMDGRAVNIHRTFLEPNDKKRAAMPGLLPEGSAVRLYPVHGERLGIAEGIETAIAAAKRFNLPVWSALNSGLLAKWTPPEGVTSVVVFGDNDPEFGGQAAAYALAHRLSVRVIRVQTEVQIPAATGRDWADADVA